MTMEHKGDAAERAQLIGSVMGENYLSSLERNTLIESLAIKQKREGLVLLLRAFDAFCSDNDIRYFVFGDTLRGVVSYGSFLPGAESLDVGMLRGDYEKLIALSSDTHPAWSVVDHYGAPYSSVRRVNPLIRSLSETRVMHEGRLVFGSDSMPIELTAEFELRIFDEVPDDFFMRKKFFRQMKRRNDLLKNALGSREYFKGKMGSDFDPEGELVFFKGMNYRRAFARRLIPVRLAAHLDWKKASKYQGSEAKAVTAMMMSRSKTCLVEDLGEMPYKDFAGIKVRAPQRPDLWAMEPVMETTPELKRLQDDAKAIVKEIDRVCQKLGIEYFACGGTMLGYMRHGGFIPWDDDIDIGMFRADYERFKKEAGAVIDSKRFFLQTRDTDPNIPYLFSKVRMNGTEYLTEYNLERDFHKGICVDVFPFDYIPNASADQRVFRGEVKKAEKRHNRIVNRQYPEPPKIDVKKNLDWLVAQVNGRLLARHYWSYSLNETQRGYDEVAMKYDSSAMGADAREFVASFVPTYTMARVSDLVPFQRVRFEDIELNLPANPHEFLKMQYGDYMTMPYPHQRAGHDLLLWSDQDGIGGGRFADESGIED